ncbi:NLI interacting factor [Macleaya cordata]|uniref:Mitochondrial import inner membrane translocase subunit TIM50 n=1 Tax=Macleaya cordata TaxID=56857 RepID=A0A200PSI6_MACCD|nr:NLI interacting factor [Macleaya cordata]
MKLKDTVDDEIKAFDDNVFISEENPSDEIVVPSSSSSSSTHDHQDVKKSVLLKNKEQDDDKPLEILSGEGKISGEEEEEITEVSLSSEYKKEEMIHLSSTTIKISDLKEEKFSANNNLKPPTASASSRRRRRRRCKKEKVKQIDNEDDEEAASEYTTIRTSEHTNLPKEEKSASSPINGGGVVKKDDTLNISPDSPLVREPDINCSRRRKLLVLDLNGLLVDIGKRSFFKRPFCDDFLQFCFEKFNVGVWSSRTKENVNRVVDFVMGDLKQNLLFCWDMSHCTETGFRTIENRYKPLVLKELKKLWDKHEHSLPWEKGNYNESNTLLLDDSPYKALCNPLHTAIFPVSFTREDKEDNSLGPGGDLWVYLEGLVVAENVQKYVEQHPFGQSAITKMHPSWHFYRRVICSNAQKMNQQMDLSSLHFMEKWEHFKRK